MVLLCTVRALSVKSEQLYPVEVGAVSLHGTGAPTVRVRVLQFGRRMRAACMLLLLRLQRSS
jgi:hypothetical protein